MDVGFIGGGTIAGWHAERVTDLGHDVAAIADIDPDARRAFAAEHDADGRYEDYETMIADATLDVVVVAVPNALHADCAVAALEAGCHVFVEKPLAHDLDGAERIADAEADSDGEVMVGFMKAFDASTEAVADAVDAGEFGDVYEVSVEYVRRRGIPQLGSWFTRKDASGGGAVVDIGPHMLHLALHLLDFPGLETVSATAGTHFGDRDDYTYLGMWGGDPLPDAVFDVEDHARALVRTAAGAIHLNVTWASNREPRQQVQVLGDEAGATIDAGEDDVTIHSTRGDGLSDETLELPDRDHYGAEWEYFFEVLAGEREHTRNTVAEGVHVQRVIEGIYESADRGAEVTL